MPEQFEAGITREGVEIALGEVWDWYQPDDKPPRPLTDILRDVAADLQHDRDVALAAFRLVKAHENHMNLDVREEDKLMHEVNSLRTFPVGLGLVLK
ncbi:MAG: hypothetical protein ACWGQW_05320 [bacterium]